MREGFPTRTQRNESVDVPRALHDIHARLEVRMTASGHTYTMNENKESLSLHADADSFAPLLGHLEELLSEMNATAQKGVPHLSIVVRGMHAVEVRAM